LEKSLPPDYYKEKTAQLEEIGCDILNELGFRASRNNLGAINQHDYIVSSGVFFDFQFSEDFSRYGDVRIDLVSAYLNHNNYTRMDLQNRLKLGLRDDSSRDLREYLGKFLTISKMGKYFETDDVKAVLYFFFDHKYVAGTVPDHIVLISNVTIRTYLANNWKSLIARDMLKLNIKSHLGDRHGSAFFCARLADLIREYCDKKEYFSQTFQARVIVWLDRNIGE